MRIYLFDPIIHNLEFNFKLHFTELKKFFYDIIIGYIYEIKDMF